MIRWSLAGLALIALGTPALAQQQQRPWAHPTAICVVSQKHGGGSCAPKERYAQAGDACSCAATGLFGGKPKPGTVTWARR